MMAVSAELQKQYDTAKAKRDAADLALKNASLLNLGAAQKAFTSANTEFAQIKIKYDEAVAEEEKAVEAKQEEADQVAEQRSDLLAQAEKDLRSATLRLGRARSGNASAAKITELTTLVDDAQVVVTAIENGATGKIVKVPGTNKVQVSLDAPASSFVNRPSSSESGRATAQMRGEGMGPVETVEEDEPVIDETVEEDEPVSNTVVSTQSATLATDQKTFVDSEITKRKLKNTPANREKLRKEFQSKNKPVDDMAWMDEFKKTYAAYSDWTTNEVIDHFGQDFVDILKEAVNTEFTDEEIQARIKGTQYFKSITDSQYRFDGASSAVQNGLLQSARDAIVKDYADVGLAQTDIDEIARKVARNGLTATGVKQAVYQYAFRRPEAATTPTSPAMATRALEGGDADTIRQSARTYGYKVSDAELQAVLTGGMYNGVAVTRDSILQKAQKAAKGAYGHLADQIDAGLSLEDIFSNYRNYAADLLEIDPNQIDFTKDGKWAKAFGSKETGQMSLTDWISTVKSDPSFGWQFTKQANQQATDIGLTLARAFGKVS
jgi:hypothetical protein